MRILVFLGLFLPLSAWFGPRACADEAAWRAGAASAKITPPEPIPMAGYAGRGDRPAEGTLTDLWAKALVLEDAGGRRAVMITLDLCDMDRLLAQAICDALGERHGLQRDQIALCVSHTHTGPVVGKTLQPMYTFLLDEEGRRRIAEYTDFLARQAIAAADAAIGNLADARLAWGSGRCTVAVNRRENPEAQVPELREQGKLRGPHDHDVPVLAVRNTEGRLTAVLFGYACHCTTLSSMQWSGDYAGFAQIEIEKAHPGCTAMFWAGCGADQNPLPRRTVELARQYGQRLAQAVCGVVDGEDNESSHLIRPTLRTAYREVDLAFDTLPTEDDLRRQAESSDKYVASRANELLKQIAAGRPLEPTYPYPVGVWRLGDEVALVILGGEVVVDYSLRLKREFGSADLQGTNIWVAAYANDEMAYIPSERVLAEGGYEGGGAMVYFGLPTAWAPGVETTVIDTVRDLLDETQPADDAPRKFGPSGATTQ